MEHPTRLAAEGLRACGQTEQWTPAVADALTREITLWEFLQWLDTVPVTTAAKECLLAFINFSVGV